MRAAAGWNLSDADVQVAIRDNFHQELEGMQDLVRGLSRSHELVLLSDHAKEWVEYIETIHPFLSIFRRRVFSFQTGLMKNSADTFRRLCSELGRQPAECLFIDDNAGNVACAAAGGMMTIRFTGREALEQEMVRLAVLGNP